MYRPIYAGSTGRNTHLVTSLQKFLTTDRRLAHELRPCVPMCYCPSVVRGSRNPGYFGLPSRLKKTRQQAGLTRLALAEKVGSSNATVGYLESGQRWSNVGTVARIAAALGCSAAWLAYGLGEPTDPSSATSEGMGDRLLMIREQRGLTKAALAELSGFSPGAILGIERGGQAGVDTIETLAKALGVSPGWLAYGLGPMEPPSRRRARPAAAAN